MLRFYRRIDANLAVMSPLFIPVQGHAILDRFNNMLLRLQLNAVLFITRMKKPVLWVENVRAADLIRNMNWRLVVYHVSDRFEDCPYTKNKDKLRKREKLITDASDLIICVSQELFADKKESSATVRYLPHGVDFEKFRNAAQARRTYAGLNGCRRPVVGYFGTLTAENDIALLEHCASRLPDATFVLAGQVTGGDYSTLQSMPNVVFPGRVPYDEIPLLCATFDVCILPWRMNPWIESCNPLKFFEYMAAGRPVVSVPIKEVGQYHHLVSIADSRDEFCRLIRWELSNDTPDRAAMRVRIAGEHSWCSHIEMISAWISEALNRKESGRESAPRSMAAHPSLKDPPLEASDLNSRRTADIT